MTPDCWRDRVAAAVCNWVLRHVATGRYRQLIDGAIKYGLAAAARDELAGAPPPDAPRAQP